MELDIAEDASSAIPLYSGAGIGIDAGTRIAIGRVRIGGGGGVCGCGCASSESGTDTGTKAGSGTGPGGGGEGPSGMIRRSDEEEVVVVPLFLADVFRVCFFFSIDTDAPEGPRILPGFRSGPRRLGAASYEQLAELPRFRQLEHVGRLPSQRTFRERLIEKSDKKKVTTEGPTQRWNHTYQVRHAKFTLFSPDASAPGVDLDICGPD